MKFYDIYVIEVRKGVIDKNGKTKNVLKCLLLSKERECYKERNNKSWELNLEVRN